MSPPLLERLAAVIGSWPRLSLRAARRDVILNTRSQPQAKLCRSEIHQSEGNNARQIFQVILIHSLISKSPDSDQADQALIARDSICLDPSVLSLKG